MVMKNPQTIELHVERLVLHGFAADQRYRISETVKQELARLIETHGVPATLVERVSVEALEGKSFNVNREPRPQQIGSQVAQAVFRALK